MRSDLADLYQELILDHGKRPRNFGAVASPTHQAEGYNPLCGDRVIVQASIDDTTIDDIKFNGVGCAICMASASLMTEQLKGSTTDAAEQCFQQFQALMTGAATTLPDAMSKLLVLAGVTRYPMRVKCATLPWHTMRAAIRSEPTPACTE